MPRDRQYSATVSSNEALLDPLIDFYPLESQAYVFRRCRDAIADPDVLHRLGLVQQARTNLGLAAQDYPVRVIENDYQNRYGKRLSYDASSFFVQAKDYYHSAAKSRRSMAPVLFYYGFMFLLSSLQHMCFRIPNRSQTHGLQIRWPQAFPSDNGGLSERVVDDFLTQVAVRISPRGAFARFRDTLSILDGQNIFSLIDDKGPNNNPMFSAQDLT